MKMNTDELKYEASRFRRAIEKARMQGEFSRDKIGKDRMLNFPEDCCDDSADLFTHYLFEKYKIDSMRIDANYYDNRIGCTCGHSWQETCGLIVDITGDQFDNNQILNIKAESVYVGDMDDFHRQFTIFRREHSCGIYSLGDQSWKRMFWLYNAIIKYI